MTKFKSELTDQEIANLMGSRQGPQGTVSHVTKWRTDYHEEFKAAVLGRKDSVILGGRRFLLKHDDPPGKCYFYPERGFVPCGQISYSVLESDAA